MARISTYVNANCQAEKAFCFHAGVFGTEITTLARFSDTPGMADALPADERDLVLHAELPILADHVLMATDMLASQGQSVRIGNNTTLNLEVDTRADADALYAALSDGGSEGSPMADMPWGQYWGVTLDRYGIRWMLGAGAAS